MTARTVSLRSSTYLPQKPYKWVQILTERLRKDYYVAGIFPLYPARPSRIHSMQVQSGEN